MQVNENAEACIQLIRGNYDITLRRTWWAGIRTYFWYYTGTGYYDFFHEVASLIGPPVLLHATEPNYIGLLRLTAFEVIVLRRMNTFIKSRTRRIPIQFYWQEAKDNEEDE